MSDGPAMPEPIIKARRRALALIVVATIITCGAALVWLAGILERFG